MVLPFGLNSDGQHITNRSMMITPTAPPIDESSITITSDDHHYNNHNNHNNQLVNSTSNHSLYVDFIVVNGNHRHIVRTERKTILESSVELAKIINSGSAASAVTIATTTGRGIGTGTAGHHGYGRINNDNNNQFIVNNVNKDDFELVIRYLETKFIKFRDHNHILSILEISDRFNCPDLVIHCVKELDLQLSSLIVLDVFRSLWYYNCITPIKCRRNNNNTSLTDVVITKEKNKKNKKNRKNLDNNNINSNNIENINSTISIQPFTPEEYISALLNNTLQLIDMQAELILTKNDMLQLRFEELEMIVKRDTLQIQTECVLFNCLADWSIEECKRKKLDLTDENRRRVLGPLCYTPKYLLMNEIDFHKCCDRVELLDTFEIQLINDILLSSSSSLSSNKNFNQNQKYKNLTNEQINMLEYFRTQRPQYAKLPIYLSDRTNPKNYCKKMRRAAEKMNKNNEDSCCQSFGLNCLAIFACIFD